MSFLSFPKRKFTLSADEIAILLITIVGSALMAAYVLHLGLTKALTDQSAHLNFGRLVFDSVTPGISQLGFWPPLLQLAIAPFATNTTLYQTGLAGYFAILPFLCLGTISFYRLTRNLTNSRLFAWAGVLMLLANPYVLYYSVTPMMEVLFVCNLIATAYVLLRWLQTNSVNYLVWTGVFVTLTSISRYEGLILIPIVGLTMLIKLYRDRASRSKTEATLLLFAMVAIVGLSSIVIYSTVFGGNPFTFAGGDWIRDPLSNLTITKHSIVKTVQYLLGASYYNIGTPFVFVSLASFVALIFKRNNRLSTLAILVVLFSPMIFVGASMFAGSSSVLVPNLPPYNFFHNDRYTLTWIGFAILAPLILLSNLLDIRGRFSRILRPVSIMVATLALMLGFGYSTFQLYTVSVAQKFSTITRNINTPSDDQIATADFLHAGYDFGKILITRSNNDPVLASAQIPLKNYIYEANYRYYSQTKTEPWLFARWVVMYNTADTIDTWSSQHEILSQELGKSLDFNTYYSLAYQNGSRKVFKINETAMLRLAAVRGYNPLQIPSLHENVENWQTSTVYAQIMDVSAPTPEQLIDNPILLKAALIRSYDQQLLPQFQKGFFVDASSNGTAQNQGYALLQAYHAGDQATFEQVWTTTKTNLQNSDHLFASTFQLVPGYLINVTNKNTSTDADTDIAYALLQAGQTWHITAYTEAAQDIMQSIWNKETVATVGAKGRHVIAGDYAVTPAGLVMNPSYFTPYAYRAFAMAQPANDWTGVVTQGYADINSITNQNSQAHAWAFLPPNWAVLNPTTGAVSAYASQPNSVDYTTDAYRALWRLSQDLILNKSVDAQAYLSKVTVFANEWNKSHAICSTYQFSQTSSPCTQDIAAMAGAESVAQATDQTLARHIVSTYYLTVDGLRLPDKTDYARQSWYWFALSTWASR
jgi:endo-1,4-beta-D-glucanase Y